MMTSKIRLAIILISPLFTIYNATSCMDGYPQLQLQEPQKNPIKAARAKLHICCSTAHYALSSCPDPNTQICFNGRPPRYINDPLIYVKLIFENNGSEWNNGDMYKIQAPLPAKHLFNLNDGSVIQFSILNTKNPNPYL